MDTALRQFEQASSTQRRIVVFGGLPDDVHHGHKNYQRIGKALQQARIQKIFLFGSKDFNPLLNEINQSSPSIETACYPTYLTALKALKQESLSHDYVLIKGEVKQSLDTLIETFQDSVTSNQCLINLAAIKSNLSMLRKKLPSYTRLMVMVKALAYGTDDVQMAKFLSTCGIDIIGVSYVDEGVTLKKAGVTQAIFSVHAALYEVFKVVKWELEIGVSDLSLTQALAEEAAKQGKIIKVHLHINTGMGRLGCRPEEALEIAQFITLHEHLAFEGILTHFACSDDPQQDAFTWQQVTCFDRVIADLQAHGIDVKWKHAANSSGAVRFSLPQYNMVRVGLAVYGLYVSEANKEAVDLRLALSLTSRIVGINHCKKGESISYGRRYIVEKEMQKIAVLPIGYFDGLHRQYSGKGHVLIRGKKAPMVGNICMDYLMVDITDIPQAQVGDKVLIFGEDELGQYLSPEELASSGDSIIHELITCLGPRIQRIFIYEEGRQIR